MTCKVVRRRAAPWRIVNSASLLTIVLAAACARPTQPRVVIIRQMVEKPFCEVPPLPARAVIVGFPVDAPNGLSLAVTKSDGTELRRELDGLREVITAISACRTRRDRQP